MKTNFLQSSLLVGAAADLAVCGTHPVMPDCVRDCATQLAGTGGLGSELSTACSNSTIQAGILHCLSTSCGINYGSALVSYLSSCLDLGATLTTVYPVQMQNPSLLPRQLLPITPGPVLNVTEDELVGGIQQDFSVTIECKAGPDGLLTLSLPDSTPCFSDGTADGEDNNEIRPYPGDGINPDANGDIVRDDPAGSGNEPPAVPASKPCESGDDTSPLQPGNPATTDAQGNIPDNDPPSDVWPTATSTIPLPPPADATGSSAVPCTTDQIPPVDPNAPTGQLPQTTAADEQVPPPIPSDVIASTAVPVESDAGAPTNVVPPATGPSAPSQPTSTFVESFPPDLGAADDGQAGGSVTSGNAPQQTVTTVGDSATEQVPASEATLWPLPSSNSPTTWTRITTLDTSLSMITEVTTLLATTITFVKAEPPSGWVHYTKTATVSAPSAPEPLEVTLWPVSTQTFYADEQPDRIEGVVVVTLGSGDVEGSQTAILTASNMDAAISAIPDLVTFPEAAHAMKRDTNADRAYEATNDTMATFLKSTHGSDYDSEKVYVVPVAAGSDFKVAAFSLALVLIVGQLVVI